MNLANLLRILFSVICLFMLGCSLTTSELKIAEQIMETAPDSALTILRNIQPNQLTTSDDKALYGLLLFQALDKNKLTLKPDSLINFSIDYYQNNNDKHHLANAYFFKARTYKYAQHYDEATLLYLKALDNCEDNKEYALLGKIYADMGDICYMQGEYKKSRGKYLLSANCSIRERKNVDVSYRLLDIGRTYSAVNQFKFADNYYRQAFNRTKDSVLLGVSLQEIGVNYYWAKQYDSAQYYLRKSLLSPFEGFNYAVRCYTLADLYFKIEQYDSANHYATVALEHPSNFFTQRECYRVLANTEYMKGDLNKMGYYMTQFQSCTDSVRKIESQTKTTILERIHQSTQTVVKTQSYLAVLEWIIPIVILLGFFSLFMFRKQNKEKEYQLEQQLNQKQLQLIENKSLFRSNVMKTIEDTKILQATTFKRASLVEREVLIIELYNSCLHTDNWEEFVLLMNQTFNNLIVALETRHPDITRKELTWCCLNLLNVERNEMALVLSCKMGSLYKLKQRLVQKTGLTSTKELDALLVSISQHK